MKPAILCLCIMLMIYLPMKTKSLGVNGLYYDATMNQGIQILPMSDIQENQNSRKHEVETMVTELHEAHGISAMDALDLVKERYAANFVKVFPDTGNEYYYKLSIADYYLVYEGIGETDKEYLIHLYEFVLDEPTEGIGHTVTYGWYTVDSLTGVITQQLQ